MAKPKANATAKPFNHEGHEVREGTIGCRLQATGYSRKNEAKMPHPGKAGMRTASITHLPNYPFTQLLYYPLTQFPRLPWPWLPLA
jgi:hypothetical protein